MIGSPATPQLPINVRGGLGVGVRRQGGAVVVELANIALTTAGVGQTYTATSPTGDLRPSDGMMLLLRIDRSNPAAPLLDLDSSGPRPWRDGDGVDLAAGALPPQRFVRVTFDASRLCWISDIPSLSAFDFGFRAWMASLPTAPDGLGPGKPWKQGDASGGYTLNITGTNT